MRYGWLLVVSAVAFAGCTFKAVLVRSDAQGDGLTADVASEDAGHDVAMDTASDVSRDVVDVMDVTDACSPCGPTNDHRDGAVLLFSTAERDAGPDVTDAADAPASDALDAADAADVSDVSDVSDSGDAAGADAVDASATDALDASGDVADGGTDGAMDGAGDGATDGGGTDAAMDGGVRASLTVRATTVGADHSVNALCEPSQGADVFFRFDLGDRELVYADTFPATWATVLFFADSNGNALNPTGASDYRYCDVNTGCANDHGSQVVGLFDPGEYYLILSGVGAATGIVDIHVKHLPVGDVLASGRGITGLVQGQTAHSGSIVNGVNQAGICQTSAGGENDTYWWTTCPSDVAGSLTAFVCPMSSLVGVSLGYRSADSLPNCGNTRGSSHCFLFGTDLTAPIAAGEGLHSLSVFGAEWNTAGAYQLNVTRP